MFAKKFWISPCAVTKRTKEIYLTKMPEVVGITPKVGRPRLSSPERTRRIRE